MKIFILLFALSIAGLASTVSSITCSGQTATVNSTAHGLIASQGFSLSGTAPTFNSTASTVTTNSFTFVLPTGTSCSGFTSGYTNVQPAKQIIDLTASTNPVSGTVTLGYVFWFSTAYPNPLPCNLPPPSGTNCPVSMYPLASTAETAALIAGTTVEVFGSLTVPAATTAPTIETQIIGQYNTIQTGFANFILAGGYWWNGTAWVNH